MHVSGSLKHVAIGALALCGVAASVVAQGQAVPPAAAPSAGSVAPAPAAEPDVDVGARGERGRGGPLAACRADLRSLCGDIERGRGARKARIECLVANRDKASPECTSAISAIEAGQGAGGRAGRRSEGGERRGAMAACRTDVATHCSVGEPANGGRLRCLRDNAVKLTPECTAALGALREAAANRR